ncbi:DUF3109 family protein [bacterium]|nr:MAG: DUF3109 family protein [bacterium]
MFQIDNVLLSDDIATVKFACDISRCKGACCVVGDAGAPVEKSEIPILKKAYQVLKGELRPEAVKEVETNGLISEKSNGDLELACTNNEACVFVVFDKAGIAYCAIQQAFYECRLNWEKPISCHLFPIRISKIGELEYANYQYVPSICSTACERGKKEGIYLADFIRKPLERKYGKEWADAFAHTVQLVRKANRV